MWLLEVGMLLHVDLSFDTLVEVTWAHFAWDERGRFVLILFYNHFFLLVVTILAVERDMLSDSK
jgi:hypothetical protein